MVADHRTCLANPRALGATGLEKLIVAMRGAKYPARSVDRVLEHYYDLVRRAEEIERQIDQSRRNSVAGRKLRRILKDLRRNLLALVLYADTIRPLIKGTPEMVAMDRRYGKLREYLKKPNEIKAYRVSYPWRPGSRRGS